MNGQNYNVIELLEALDLHGVTPGNECHKEVRRNWKAIRASLPYMEDKDLSPTPFSLYRHAKAFRFATNGRTRAIYHHGGAPGAAVFATEWYHETIHNEDLTPLFVYNYIAELYLMAIEPDLVSLSKMDVVKYISEFHSEAIKMIGTGSEYKYSKPNMLHAALHKRLLTEAIFRKLKRPFYGLANQSLFGDTSFSPFSQITQQLFENYRNFKKIGDARCKPVHRVYENFESKNPNINKLDLYLEIGMNLVETAQTRNFEMGDDALHVAGHILGEALALANPRLKTTEIDEDKINHVTKLVEHQLSIITETMGAPLNSNIDQNKLLHHISNHLLGIHSVSKKKKQETPKQDRIIHAAWLLKPSALMKY